MSNFKDKERWKKNLSISLSGVKKSKTHCENISRGKIGLKHSRETKLKMSLAQKGKRKSKQHAKNISIGHKGVKLSLAHRRKLSESHMGQPAYWKGKKLPEYIKEKIRNARLKQIFPTKDTKPEKILQFNLAVRKVDFFKHISLTGQPDIFIYPNWCIFVDGDYWHSTDKQKERDTFVNKELKNYGYKIIRIPEFAIKKYPNLITEFLIGRIFI